MQSKWNSSAHLYTKSKECKNFQKKFQCTRFFENIIPLQTDTQTNMVNMLKIQTLQFGHVGVCCFILIPILLHTLRPLLTGLFGIYCLAKYLSLYLTIPSSMLWCLGGFICPLNVLLVSSRIGLILSSLFEASTKKINKTYSNIIFIFTENFWCAITEWNNFTYQILLSLWVLEFGCHSDENND